jgi:hypothetical protein
LRKLFGESARILTRNIYEPDAQETTILPKIITASLYYLHSYISNIGNERAS